MKPYAPPRDGFKVMLAIVLGIAALLMGYVAMTVPMIAMTGPSVITIALVAGAVFAWRSSSKPMTPEHAAYNEQLRQSRVSRENPTGMWPPPEKTIHVAGRDLKDHR
jgi:hypothetical protein